MNLIKTPSFKLATISKGDPDSPKFALVLPGKLDTKDYAHMVSHVDFLAGLGFHALSFDPPGTWESPGDISLYTTTNYLKSINELIEHFGNKPTFVMGHSRGGSLAMLAGISNSYVSSFAPIMSFAYSREFRAEEKDWERKGFIISMRDLPPGGGGKVKRFELPYSFHIDHQKYNIVEGLKKSKKPKLFILGKQDKLVTPEDVKKGYETSAEPKELFELESGHDYRLHKDKIDEVNKVIENFLLKYSI